MKIYWKKRKTKKRIFFTAEEENKEEDPGHGEMETEEDFGEEEVPGEENPSETEADKEKTAEFILKVRPETETARAGSRIFYRVTVENTGEIPLENLKFQEDIGGEELSGQVGNCKRRTPGRRKGHFIGTGAGQVFLPVYFSAGKAGKSQWICI